MSSLFSPPSMPTPPPPPEPPAKVDYARAEALSEEALEKERSKRKGRGSTIVAGLASDTTMPTSGTPTLLG